MVTTAGHAASGHVTATHAGEAHSLNPATPRIIITHVPEASTSSQVGTVEKKKEDPSTVNDDYARQGAWTLGVGVILVIVVVAAFEYALRSRSSE
jgi:hypothetical protein